MEKEDLKYWLSKAQRVQSDFLGTVQMSLTVYNYRETGISFVAEMSPHTNGNMSFDESVRLIHRYTVYLSDEAMVAAKTIDSMREWAEHLSELDKDSDDQ